MAVTFFSESEFWQQIDLSESYMVSGMFEEAAAMSSSIIKQLRSSISINSVESSLIAEMMESAGMVFIQSLKELHRTRELFDELPKLFSSVAAIPVQVFLTGACFQISEGCTHNLKTIFEEFIEKWVVIKDELNVLPNTELNSSIELWQSAIPLEKYLEVVDVYAITILGMVLHKPDVAISWLDRSVLPEENKQDMLRRLHSLHLASHLSSSLGQITAPKIEGRGCTTNEGSPNAAELKNYPKENEHNITNLKLIQPSMKHISDRTVRLKLGNFALVLPRGKIVFLSSLMLFTFYILQKRRAVLKRIIVRQASSIKKALIDAWRLAFSVQVNPLAAAQQLPAAASSGSR